MRSFRYTKNFFTLYSEKKFGTIMCLRKELSNVQKGGIIAAKKLGHSNSRISAVVGCSRSSVRRVWKSYELKQLLKKRTGRPRILNKAERKHFKRSVVRNKKTRRQTLSQIHLNIINKTNKLFPNKPSVMNWSNKIFTRAFLASVH